MDPYTYGDSEAAKTLAKILTNSPKDIRYKTSRMLHRYFKGINAIVNIKDKELRVYLLTLWLEENLKQADFSQLENSEQFPKTYIKNVIHMKHAMAIKGEIRKK
jgi:hypothetical protein